MRNSRLGLSSILALIAHAAHAFGPPTAEAPTFCHRGKKKSNRSRAARSIPYGETLRAHFAAKNLTPQRVMAHKQYLQKQASR